MSKLEDAPTAYTFDDFVLVPQYSEVGSRTDPDITSDIDGFRYKIPIVASPMNTVTEAEMLVTMAEIGAVGVLHRYMDIVDQVKIATEVSTRLSDAGIPLQQSDGTPAFYVAVGANGDVEDRVRALSKVGVTGFCVDVANGHNEQSVQAVRAIRRLSPEARIMAGNVCTYDGAYTLAKAGASSIRVGIGPGCFTAGTRILMSNGIYKNIEDVRPGDHVINKDGKAVIVKNAWCTGRRKVMKVRHTQFYKPTYCTDDHNYLVGDLSGLSPSTVSSRGYANSLKEDDIKWQEIGNLNRHTVLMPRNINFELPETFEIKLQKRTAGNRLNNFVYKTDTTIVPTYDSGYIFGTFLGDGCSNTQEYKKSKRGNVKWYFGPDEDEIANNLARAIKTTIGKEVTVKKTNIISVTLCYKPLADYFKNFGKKENKRLPTNLLVNNKEFLSGLLQGLLDSDGHKEKTTGRVGFTNTSIYLMELFGVVEYLTNGYFPNMLSKGNSTSKLIKNSQEAFAAQRLLAAKKREFGDYQIVKLLEKDFIEKECEVYDIEVDCPTHSFIANNAIVHNSNCTTRQVTAHGVPQLSAIEDCARIKSHESQENFPNVAIIADGGIKRSGDIIKALAIGADAIMIGSLLAGTKETPGEVIEEDGKQYKYYHGMASNEARSKWKGQRIGVPEEGVSRKVPYYGKEAKDVVLKLASATQVGLSFSGALNIEELRERATWRKISAAGYTEGTPHGK